MVIPIEVEMFIKLIFVEHAFNQSARDLIFPGISAL